MSFHAIRLHAINRGTPSHKHDGNSNLTGRFGPVTLTSSLQATVGVQAMTLSAHTPQQVSIPRDERQRLTDWQVRFHHATSYLPLEATGRMQATITSAHTHVHLQLSEDTVDHLLASYLHHTTSSLQATVRVRGTYTSQHLQFTKGESQALTGKFFFTMPPAPTLAAALCRPLEGMTTHLGSSPTCSARCPAVLAVSSHASVCCTWPSCRCCC